jgi:hypothetical protein
VSHDEIVRVPAESVAELKKALDEAFGLAFFERGILPIERAIAIVNNWPDPTRRGTATLISAAKEPAEPPAYPASWNAVPGNAGQRRSADGRILGENGRAQPETWWEWAGSMTGLWEACPSEKRRTASVVWRTTVISWWVFRVISSLF